MQTSHDLILLSKSRCSSWQKLEKIFDRSEQLLFLVIKSFKFRGYYKLKGWSKSSEEGVVFTDLGSKAPIGKLKKRLCNNYLLTHSVLKLPALDILLMFDRLTFAKYS